MSSSPRLVALLAILAAPSIAAAQASSSTPLDDYRRVEMRVPADFTSDCRTRGRVVTCAVSTVPEEFPDLMFGLRGGSTAGVTLRGARTGSVIRFDLKRGDLTLQEAILEKPRRWVVEVGRADVLMGPVREQLPFRPYPMSTDDLGMVIPPPNIQPVPARSEAAQKYGPCYQAWREQQYRAAIDLCQAVDVDAPDAVPGRMARKIIAESWVEVMAIEATDDLPAVTEALITAENLIKNPVERVRYTLLAARAFERLNYLNRAELHLDNRERAYEGTLAEPYLLAARARMLMKVGDQDKARAVLGRLRTMPGNAPTIGKAIIAMAGLAYQERAWVMAAGLFDLAAARWPGQIDDLPGALFQSAELYLLYDRVEDARRNYETFLEAFPTHEPHWIARLRLTEIQSYTEPAEARAAFRSMAASLKEKEGQDLAFLRYAQLLDVAAERRRVISNLANGARSEYVLEELTVRSIQQHLDDGRLDEAYTVARAYWRRVEGGLLLEAPQLFDRVLFLVARARAADPLRVLRMYYGDRERFEKHALRGEVHLLVGRALRELAMYAEAVRVMQNGLGGTTAAKEPDAAARLYRELAAALWESRDAFRLKQIIEYLDTRHPRRFDDYEYWMAKAHDAWWSDKPGLARDMMVYALNGPLTTVQRLDTMDILVELYAQQAQWDRALKVLASRIELHDEARLPRLDIGRRDARWRTAEIEIDRRNWGPALAALMVFLDEYPDDPERLEARFLAGRCLLALGDADSAREQWDLVAKEGADGVFGKMAMLELELLRWRRTRLAQTAGRVGL